MLFSNLWSFFSRVKRYKIMKSLVFCLVDSMEKMLSLSQKKRKNTFECAKNVKKQ